jgi:xanthosine utilization system XapX-like protein
MLFRLLIRLRIRAGEVVANNEIIGLLVGQKKRFEVEAVCREVIKNDEFASISHIREVLVGSSTGRLINLTWL